jgi:hypothetical protein
MAGDWIKMRKSLPADPRVVRISSALKADRLRTIGGLMSAWCLLDEQTEDGKLEGYTPEIFDEIIGFPGLARAMASVGWMEIGDGFIAAPRFDEHNGQSAKRRAQDSFRKMSARKADKSPHEKQTNCGLEKRREEKNILPLSPKGELSEFLESVWKAGPIQSRTRSSKRQLESAWKKTPNKPEESEVLRVLGLWVKSHAWTKDNCEFVPGIHRWIQNRQWENEPETFSQPTIQTRGW